MDEKKKKETLNHFFKVLSKSSDRCLEPNETCDQKAIQSHSIPVSTILQKLSKDGHVIMPKSKLKYPPPVEIDLKSIGINKATTFSGLCSDHDREIFRPIDIDLPDLSDPLHLFLLAYRSVLREYHVCLQNGLRFQSTYIKRTEVGISPKNEPDNFGMFATAHLINAYECYEYKRQFDKYFLQHDWSKLKHFVIILKNQPATIAVSSLFSLDEIIAPDTPRVILNVYPSDNNVIVLFSTIKSDEPFVSKYLRRILTSSGYYQKYLLSKLILQSCDNFVLSPEYFESFSQERKNVVCNYFINTMTKNDEKYENKLLYLF